ncbi:MAG: lipid-A-disaccharide synthase [Hyphomicrobiaceae bacterium]
MTAPIAAANDPSAAPHIVIASARAYTIFIVAGEHSGDALGAKLMAALNAQLPGRVRYLGVGGAQMERQGLISQFPLADVAVMGPFAILKRLPKLVSRVYQTVNAAISAQPDVVVIIDSPEFTHPIAKRIRRRLPGIPIVNYVSPTIWAWRPGRARKMVAYVDHVLALLPFEPAAHKDLGGPPCTYVGHPLVERLPWLATLDPAPFLTTLGLDPSRPILLVLPGSRRSEVERLLADFGQAVALVVQRRPGIQVIIPAMPNVRSLIEEKVAAWPKDAGKPIIFEGDDETAKFSAFKAATAALAASGTVTLELALTATPMVVAYKVDAVISTFRHIIKAKTCVLPNLITNERAVPEFLQEDCTPEKLAAALDTAMCASPERTAQRAELARVPDVLALKSGSPSEAAAKVVLDVLARTKN